MTTFKFLDRGRKDTLVLIPGWAADYHIFASLDLNYNYLLPLNFSADDFAVSLLAALKERQPCGCSLLGWSLGGFLAAEFASAHPTLIERLILVSVRKKYPRAEIEQIKDFLLRSKRGYLSKFYQECCSDKAEWAYFKKNLLRAYLEFELTDLIAGLEYLAEREFTTTFVKEITLIQGQLDKIAPLSEALMIKETLPPARFCLLKDAGHFPFFHKDFNGLINAG